MKPEGLYPSIRNACLYIARDNGGVNRYRAETQVRCEIGRFLAERGYSDHFPNIEKWLGSLNESDLEIVCAGEESERVHVMRRAPPFTETLLDEYFHEVC